MREPCLRLRLEEACRICIGIQHACATLSTTGGGGFNRCAHSARPFPNIVPNVPEIYSRSAQDGPKMAQNGPRMTQDGPRWPKDGPR